MLVENNNLLLSLAKWARSSEENYTTEAFVHLLRHLQQHEPTIVQGLLKNVCDLLIEKKEKGKQEIDLSMPLEAKDLEFKTQVGYTLDERISRPDISIVAPNYLIFVEVKVSAELGFDQLARYRAILDKEKDSRTGLLILLSRAPSTKLDRELADAAILWHRIAEWLKDALNSKTPISDVSKYLIEQFINFLAKMPPPPPPPPPPGSVSDEFRIMLLLGYDEIGRIEELYAYPRLQTLLTMMDEVIKATDGESQHILRNGIFGDEHARCEFIGYDIQDDRYSFYVCHYGKECKLLFTTWKCKIDIEQAAHGRFGRVIEKPDRWQAELNFDGQDELPEDRTLIRESYRNREFDRIQEF